MGNTRAVRQGLAQTSRALCSVAASTAAAARATSVVPEAPETGLRALHGHG